MVKLVWVIHHCWWGDFPPPVRQLSGQRHERASCASFYLEPSWCQQGHLWLCAWLCALQWIVNQHLLQDAAAWETQNTGPKGCKWYFRRKWVQDQSWFHIRLLVCLFRKTEQRILSKPDFASLEFLCSLSSAIRLNNNFVIRDLNIYLSLPILSLLC